MLVENFNNKYTNLTDKQQNILREYINSVDNSQKLKKFVIRECNLLKKEEIKKVESMTKSNENFQLNIAIGYGGRAEIVDAVKKIGYQIKNDEINIEHIDEDLLSKHLYTEGMPDPDLIIRTSGEERLSGFLLWQSAYSELYFTEVFWPAFRKIDFLRAIRVWQQRDRRFGK